MKFRIVTVIAASAVLLTSCGISDARDRALEEAAVQPMSLNNHWLPGLVGYADYPAQGLGPVGYPGVTNSDSNIDPVQNLLEGLGLLAEELPGNYTVSLIGDGDTLKTPTLGFCGGTFASEKLRVSRRQVEATADSSPFEFLSSEVVQYLSTDAARQALNEMVNQKKECPNGTVFTDSEGQKQTITFHAAPGSSSTVLVPAADRAILHFTEKSGSTSIAYFTAYEIRGNVLAALYGVITTDKPFTQAQLDVMYGILSGMSQRLLDAPAKDLGL